jgi:hypothetical protein
MNEDCGYYMGCSDGLIWYPPPGSSDTEPVLIPWIYIDQVYGFDSDGGNDDGR